MLRRFISILADVVYPKICIACEDKLKGISSVDNLICLECWGKIKRNLPPFCHRCGRHLKTNKFTRNICPACLRKPLHFDRAFSPCAYEGLLKELIHEFKYKNKDYLGPFLSKLMAEFIKEYNLPLDIIDFIIPVPLHQAKLREREFNQAEILSNSVAARFNKTALNTCLRRHRQTRTQLELDDSGRFLNVRGSFSVDKKENIKGRNVLLIDDILTTGATSSEAAYALKEAGANIVFVLTLAN
jgi:ComF family protein